MKEGKESRKKIIRREDNKWEEEKEKWETKMKIEVKDNFLRLLTSRLLFRCIAVSWNVFTNAVNLFVRTYIHIYVSECECVNKKGRKKE